MVMSLYSFFFPFVAFSTNDLVSCNARRTRRHVLPKLALRARQKLHLALQRLMFGWSFREGGISGERSQPVVSSAEVEGAFKRFGVRAAWSRHQDQSDIQINK